MDPCPGACGTSAVCAVNNHIPSCTCPPGTSGDPFNFCAEVVVKGLCNFCYLFICVLIGAYILNQRIHNYFRFADIQLQTSACSPSPCGPYSECSVSGNGAAACSCRAGHIGSPPNCRPECLVSAECKLQHACIERRCRDPCEGACGRGARCHVIAHSPICTCNDGYTGDPFTYCYPAPGMSFYIQLMDLGLVIQYGFFMYFILTVVLQLHHHNR